MIYVDTSVALAHLLAEDRSLAASFWQGNLISSRLIEYELWTCLHAPKLTSSHGELARELIGRVALVELTPASSSRDLADMGISLAETPRTRSTQRQPLSDPPCHHKSMFPNSVAGARPDAARGCGRRR